MQLLCICTDTTKNFFSLKILTWMVHQPKTWSVSRIKVLFIKGTKSCRMGRFSVCLFVRPSVRSSVPPSGPSSQVWGPTSQAWGPASQIWGPASQPAKPQASGIAGWASGLAGWPRGGEGRMYRKSPHSTGLRPLSGQLPKMCTKWIGKEFKFLDVSALRH